MFFIILKSYHLEGIFISSWRRTFLLNRWAFLFQVSGRNIYNVNELADVTIKGKLKVRLSFLFSKYVATE